MKKIFVIVCIVFVMICVLVSYDPSNNVSTDVTTNVSDTAMNETKVEDTTTDTQSEADSTSTECNLDGCNVVIKDAKIYSVGNATYGTDANIIVVTYEFTNYADDDKCFGFSIAHKAYQNGVECTMNSTYTLVLPEEDKFDSIIMNEIKPGVTVDVKVIYVLNDTTTPVNVECTKYLDFSSNPVTISKTFTIQ